MKSSLFEEEGILQMPEIPKGYVARASRDGNGTLTYILEKAPYEAPAQSQGSRCPEHGGYANVKMYGNKMYCDGTGSYPGCGWFVGYR